MLYLNLRLYAINSFVHIAIIILLESEESINDQYANIPQSLTSNYASTTLHQGQQTEHMYAALNLGKVKIDLSRLFLQNCLKKRGTLVKLAQ